MYVQWLFFTGTIAFYATLCCFLGVIPAGYLTLSGAYFVGSLISATLGNNSSLNANHSSHWGGFSGGGISSNLKKVLIYLAVSDIILVGSIWIGMIIIDLFGLLNLFAIIAELKINNWLAPSPDYAQFLISIGSGELIRVVEFTQFTLQIADSAGFLVLTIFLIKIIKAKPLKTPNHNHPRKYLYSYVNSWSSLIGYVIVSITIYYWIHFLDLQPVPEDMVVFHRRKSFWYLYFLALASFGREAIFLLFLISVRTVLSTHPTYDQNLDSRG